MNSTCFSRDPVLVNWIPWKTSYKSLTAFLFKTLHGYWKGEATIFHDFSLWVGGVNMNLRGSRHQILNETMTCWAARHVESSFVLVYIPKRRRVSLQTCLNLDILWYFLKFFSVIKYWIPIKVLGLRFADLVFSPAFALQGLCRVLELHRRTDGLELGIWKNSGDFGWTSVLIPDINIVDAFRVIGPGKSHPLPWKRLRSDRSNGNFQLKSVETVNDSFWETQVSLPRWYLQYSIHMNANILYHNMTYCMTYRHTYCTILESIYIRNYIVITYLLPHRDAASGSLTLQAFLKNLRVRKCSPNRNGL